MTSNPRESHPPEDEASIEDVDESRAGQGNDARRIGATEVSSESLSEESATPLNRRDHREVPAATEGPARVKKDEKEEYSEDSEEQESEGSLEDVKKEARPHTEKSHVDFVDDPVVDPPVEHPHHSRPADPPVEKPPQDPPAHPPVEHPHHSRPADPPVEHPHHSRPADPPVEKQPQDHPAHTPVEHPHHSRPADPPVEQPPQEPPAHPPVEHPHHSRPADPPVEHPHHSHPADPPVEQPPQDRPAHPPVEHPHHSRPADPPVEQPPQDRPADPPVEHPHHSRPTDPPVEQPHPDSAADPPVAIPQDHPAASQAPEVQETPPQGQAAKAKPSFLGRLGAFFMGKKPPPQKTPDASLPEPGAESLAGAGESSRDQAVGHPTAQMCDGEVAQPLSELRPVARDMPEPQPAEVKQSHQSPPEAEHLPPEGKQHPDPVVEPPADQSHHSRPADPPVEKPPEDRPAHPPVSRPADPPVQRPPQDRPADPPVEQPHPDSAADPPVAIPQDRPAASQAPEVQETPPQGQAAKAKPSFLGRLGAFFMGKKPPPQKTPDASLPEPRAEEAAEDGRPRDVVEQRRTLEPTAKASLEGPHHPHPSVDSFLIMVVAGLSFCFPGLSHSVIFSWFLSAPPQTLKIFMQCFDIFFQGT